MRVTSFAGPGQVAGAEDFTRAIPRAWSPSWPSPTAAGRPSPSTSSSAATRGCRSRMPPTAATSSCSRTTGSRRSSATAIPSEPTSPRACARPSRRRTLVVLDRQHRVAELARAAGYDVLYIERMDDAPAVCARLAEVWVAESDDLLRACGARPDRGCRVAAARPGPSVGRDRCPAVERAAPVPRRGRVARRSAGDVTGRAPAAVAHAEDPRVRLAAAIGLWVLASEDLSSPRSTRPCPRARLRAVDALALRLAAVTDPPRLALRRRTPRGSGPHLPPLGGVPPGRRGCRHRARPPRRARLPPPERRARRRLRRPPAPRGDRAPSRRGAVARGRREVLQ